MKLNISYPASGCQKLILVEDEKKLRPFYDKRMGQEVEGDSLGDEWKGYVFKVAGGNDKQGFPMKQGILTTGRVRLLLKKGHSCYRQRRNGERRRKSVRGCIVDANLSVLALVVKKKGEKEIEGLTDKTLPRKLGPKRASKIRKLFNLTKADDVRQYVIRRPLPVKEGKKERSRAPKIQRLITPLMLQHKRRRMAIKKARIEKRRDDEAQYARLMAQRAKEERQRHLELVRRRRSTRESMSSAGGDEPITKIKAPKEPRGEKVKRPKVSIMKLKRIGDIRKMEVLNARKLKIAANAKKALQKAKEEAKKAGKKPEAAGAKKTEAAKKAAAPKAAEKKTGGEKKAAAPAKKAAAPKKK